MVSQTASVAVLPFGVDQARPSFAAFCQEELSKDLAEAHASVVQVQARDGTAAPDVEACRKAPEGCTSALASRLGVQAFLRGNLRDDRTGHHLMLQLVAPSGQAKWTRMLEAQQDWGLTSEVNQIAPELTQVLVEVTGAPLGADVSNHPGWAPWLAGAGVVSSLGGLVFAGLAVHESSRLTTTHGITAADAKAISERGAREQRFSIGLLVAGAAAMGTGIFFWARNNPDAPTVVVSGMAGPGGGALVLSGVLP